MISQGFKRSCKRRMRSHGEKIRVFLTKHNFSKNKLIKDRLFLGSISNRDNVEILIHFRSDRLSQIPKGYFFFKDR